MSSIRTVGKHSPNLTRRKRPVTHGLYLRNNVRALQIRASDVKSIMRKAVDSFPWLREENLPTLRKWAELEVIRRSAFAGILASDGGIVFKADRKTNELSLKRLVDDHRKLVMSQLVVERELMMTPAARAQLQGGEQAIDLVAAMARSPRRAFFEQVRARARKVGMNLDERAKVDRKIVLHVEHSLRYIDC